MTGVVHYSAFAGQNGIAPVAIAIGSYGANGCFWCDSSGLPLDEPGDRNSYFTGVLLGYHGNVIRTESCILEYEPGWAAPSPIFPYP